MDFSVEDHLDSAKYNRILWTGTMGDRPYPATRSGLDLRANRAQLLKAFRERQATQAPSPGPAEKDPAPTEPAGASR